MGKAAAKKPERKAPRGPRWRRRAEARPAEILDAALTVFSAHGFAAAKLDDVAKEAGVSKGTLYLYFESKEALFEAMALELMRVPVLAQLDSIAKAETATDALRQLIQFMTRMLDDPRRSALPKLIIAESAGFPELARIWLKTVIQPVRKRLAALIEAGIASGEFRAVDPWETTKLVIAPFLLTAIWRRTFEHIDNRRFDFAALLRQHTEFLLRGLAPDAAKPGE
ncbi:TetR/AcrR family transcriptional regulator [Dongia sedimenti]|uniref:TetR/AcrR family transcriptional regulator n=1 Tax=Dongia sedimenti TaxID=3064282 RepID=A0ABU0YNS5_9PROT|nr:TetR/AcrR family transcriptional regulator [Rhodospirillaceae bacterium R-7]